MAQQCNGKDSVKPSIGQHNKPEDFRGLKASRECQVQRGYWSYEKNNYVLVGWTKVGEPIFVDNGRNVWDHCNSTDNTGRLVHNVLYWRCDQSSGGHGRMLPPNVKINPKNMWLEMPCGC